MIHVVKRGETISSIAFDYGVSTERLIYDNQISGEELVEGQALLVLIPEVMHSVAPGETLYSISRKYETSVLQILRNNPYLLENTLKPGDVLTISFTQPKKGRMQLIGYAYPFISDAVLNEVLLYIRELLVFSYGFTRMGDLIPPQGEERLIEKAREMGVRPILVLTPFSEAGTFSNQLVKAVSKDIPMQERLIENLLMTVREKNYGGVDVDFEYILPEDKDGYAAFVKNLQKVMSEEEYSVSVALAPKTSAEQKGLLYEGVDYQALGEAADHVFLMTYEWGYTYGPPMAVAPINKVRQVLDYAVTEIPVEKIFMGMPNYAYDWSLPYERGVTKAETLGNIQAVDRALQYGVPILFDEMAMTPYFRYISEGTNHEVWFEDVRSIQAKANLITEYGFAGGGYWNLMRPFRPNWMYFNSVYDLA